MRLKIQRALHQLTYSFAMLSLLTVLPAAAQKNEGVKDTRYEDWFQVEIIVFARNQINSPDAEKWSKNVALAYPPNLQLLVDPNAPAAQENLNAAVSTAINAAQSTSQTGLPAMEQPFVMLSSNQRHLNAEALQIKRNRGKRVLFHEAWRQPMLDKDSSPAIVISGGDTFDKNKELEGFVTIWLSRYLHIGTNLWFTSFEANYGQETEHWPYPPEPPKPFTPNNTNLDSGGLSNNSQWNLSLDESDKDIGLNFDAQSSQNYFQDYTNLTKQPYVVSRVVTMQQRRRMRSTELHYLDHPLMGILIQIDKFEPVLP
ncbi:hypothetical protein TDB9533_02012 [Thalassocella blandensis]|nr:hypothetical protein TDB9533_02012 [Thalassocella blandensis]